MVPRPKLPVRARAGPAPDVLDAACRRGRPLDAFASHPLAPVRSKEWRWAA
jgi:hypothetical protein